MRPLATRVLRGASVAVSGGALKVHTRKSTGHHMPIDEFFRSLADECGAAAVGVVLSGTASDGTLGLQAIKAAGALDADLEVI